uniref:Uncharacterized protein n=1 Tax=Myotis myotis TaxID=51298 RepID=A0A7J7T6K4_MYOMY|nr:hypothetical protein mMyoMyo1_009165 [Myotis myotis]
MWSSRPHAVMPSHCNNPSPGGCMCSGRMWVGGDLTLHAQCRGGSQQLRPTSLGQSIEEPRMGGQDLPLWGERLWGSCTVRGHRPGWGMPPPPTPSTQILCTGPLVKIYLKNKKIKWALNSC